MLVFAAVAQLVERVLGKDEVMGPNPISSLIVRSMYTCDNGKRAGVVGLLIY